MDKQRQSMGKGGTGLTCWRCGAQLDARMARCAACGAQRPRASRRGSSTEDVRGPSRASAVRAPRDGRKANPPKAPRRRGSREAAAPQAPRTPAPPPPMSPDQPRMIRRHEYQAITPQTMSYDHINWIRLCMISLVCVLLLCAGIFFFLRATTPGQRWLAANGREASAAAYHDVGRMFMSDGAISRAVTALEVAQIKDPDSLEILIDLGRAYMGNGQLERAELAFSRAIQNWPAYPEPYRLMIGNLTDSGRSFEALDLVRTAIEETGDSYFETLYNDLIPTTPSASPLGDRFSKEREITLTTPQEGAEIYYTLLDEDPVVKGILYEGPFVLPEGGWRVRAVAKKDGMFSEEQVQNYTIIKAVPDMPRASHGPDAYDRPIKVKLYPRGEDVVAIYYTTDGTAAYDSQRELPTPNAIRYDFNDEEASIQLRIGKTTLRAVSVNAEGKHSNELSVEYECKGQAKSAMTEKDTVGGLTLYGTTRAQFESQYGAPQSEADAGEDMMGKYTRLYYAFGYADFLDRGGDSPVLAELSTKNTAFGGPRGTGVGMRMDDVLAAFRDVGGDPRANGDRLLYQITTLENRRLGMLENLKKKPVVWGDEAQAEATEAEPPPPEEDYKISYYDRVANSTQYVELSYYVKDGLVVRMDWLRYDPA